MKVILIGHFYAKNLLKIICKRENLQYIYIYIVNDYANYVLHTHIASLHNDHSQNPKIYVINTIHPQSYMELISKNMKAINVK